jgi:hypothetical protein
MIEHERYRTLRRAIRSATTETDLERIQARVTANADQLWDWEVEWLQTAIGDRQLALWDRTIRRMQAAGLDGDEAERAAALDLAIRRTMQEPR